MMRILCVLKYYDSLITLCNAFFLNCPGAASDVLHRLNSLSVHPRCGLGGYRTYLGSLHIAFDMTLDCCFKQQTGIWRHEDGKSFKDQDRNPQMIRKGLILSYYPQKTVIITLQVRPLKAQIQQVKSDIWFT